MRPLDPRLIRRSSTVRRFLATSVVVGVLAATAVVGQSWFLARIVSDLFANDPTGSVLLAAVALLALRGVLVWAGAVAADRAAIGVKSELRHDLLASVLDPRAASNPRESARIATVMGAGLDRLDHYIGRFLPQLVVTAVVPLAVIVALVLIDPLSAVIVTLTVPLVLGFLVLVGLHTSDRLDRRWEELVRLGRHFSDIAGGIVLFKVFGRRQERGLGHNGERHRRATMEALRSAFLSAFVLELFSTISVALVAVATGLRMVEGNLGLDTGLFVILLAPEAYLPLRRLGVHYHDAAEGVRAAQDALDLLDRPVHAGKEPVAGFPVIVEDLEVLHPGRDQAALQVEHARVDAGEFIAVTGPSGSGKSTLLDVLLGFVVPTAGRVLVGGVDLVDADMLQWRSRLAWVPQFPSLVAGTIADNVRLGAPHADDDHVARALADAGAPELASDRSVAEAGANLSAGERRRVGIARALLRVRVGGADLLLMDEPTAGLDTVREQRVLDVLRRLGVTVVLVAHRPESIAAADRQIRLPYTAEVLA